jgi:osmotically inducible protein OsmC
MPLALREAEIVWEGPLARGAGTLTSGSGALKELGVTWRSRTEQPEGRTSPEELIAAAHASCFAMALALVLGGNQTPPDRLAVKAACTLDEVDGAPRITTIELAVRAQVPGLEAAALKADHRVGRRSLPGLQRAARQRRDQRAQRAPARPPRATVPQPAGGRSRRRRSHAQRIRSPHSRPAPRALRSHALVRWGRQASRRRRRLQREDQTARRRPLRDRRPRGPMSSPRDEDTRRAIEAMRRLRRASSLPGDAETGDPAQAQPGLVDPADATAVAETAVVVRARGSDRYSDP